MNYDEDTQTELMMLRTDMALEMDPYFSPWVEKYAEDKDAFFRDFAAVFSKLLELGIQRDDQGRITNVDNEKGGYHAAPKKKSRPGLPDKTSDDTINVAEAGPVAQGNLGFRSRL